MKKIIRASAAIGVAAAALVAGSLTGLGIATAVNSAAPPQEVQHSVNAVDAFPTNDFGQTYGFVDQGLLSDSDARAQLVAVTTDQGKDGWAYWAQLMPPLTADSAEEAQALSTDQPYQVAVYELDGRTPIGFHTVNRAPEPEPAG